ncbi:MAG: PIN domain-containing protein [Candidatus Brockarchaeota archaeon]|nr:PIN domain-containing protein [Candidatus Brockarchaeota archaeon]
MSYVDTSIIVAALDPEDPLQKSASMILKNEEDKIVSELVLLELASVLSRRISLTEFKEKLKVREELVVPTLLLYLLKRFGLKYEKVDGRAKVPKFDSVYFPIATAITISRRLRLKTLDLLHIAYIRLLKERGRALNTLITADEDFNNISDEEKASLEIKIRLLKRKTF